MGCRYFGRDIGRAPTLARHAVNTGRGAATDAKAGSIRQRLLGAARVPGRRNEDHHFPDCAAVKSDIGTRPVFDTLVDEGLLLAVTVIKKNGLEYPGFRLAASGPAA